MRDVVYDIDYPYAEKVLKALETEATATQVARAFQTALRRNMGLDDSQVPEFDPADKSVGVEQRFELFFGQLFTVAPKELTEPMTDAEYRVQIVLAIEFLKTRAQREKKRKDKEMEEMFLDDAENFRKMLVLFDSGDIKGSVEALRDQDTAARDNLFTGLNEIGEIRLNRYLDQY